jgi:hypothetical protein
MFCVSIMWQEDNIAHKVNPQKIFRTYGALKFNQFIFLQIFRPDGAIRNHNVF